MSKVKLTQEQANFIQGFIHEYGNEPILEGKELPAWASRAIYNISRFGFGSFMKNAQGYQVSGHRKGFEHKDKLTLIEAVIHGYEVEKKLYYLKHPNIEKLYVNIYKPTGNIEFLNNESTRSYKVKFTEQEIEENDLLSPFKDWKVEAK